jgi:3',5'-nucleoside bisphosphate phosphatase
LIDLHTHTTASDGRRTPADLVAYAASSGVTVLGVTDHDTVAGYAPAAAAGASHGIEVVPGIEITAVCEGVDVHVLGYFIDAGAAALLAFLAEQRRRRIDRVRLMIARLARHGIELDADAIVEPGIHDPSKSLGRPSIARALVDGGYVATADEAFDRWLDHGAPAFVAREAATPEEVIGRIHEAGGVASLAHPALLGRDEWIPIFAGAGLDAIEAYYPEHDESQTAHYLALAARLRIAVTGGSDYHADNAHGSTRPGSTSLPRDEYEKLKRFLATIRATASRSTTSS